MTYTAIICAAGKSLRFDEQLNKVYQKIKNKKIYLYSAEVFFDLGFEVILVLNEEEIKYVNKSKYKYIVGGKTRSESVKKGLSFATGEIVFVHDGARPLITKSKIASLLNETKKYRAFFLSKYITSSIKKIDKKGNIKTLAKNNLYEAETPQVFLRKDLEKAFSLAKKDYPDEVSLVSDTLPDIKIKPIINYEPNDKITFYDDYHKVKKILGFNYLIGHSYDIHKLRLGRKLYLGGLEIKSQFGLVGHSDADVIIHSVTEAILGALNLGDLGTNFPDNDPKYKDIRSTKLLLEILDKMLDRNYEINNIDILIYLESPKLSKYIPNIKSNLSSLLKTSKSRISIKATTTEKIGPIGQNKAIACETVILLKEVI